MIEKKSPIESKASSPAEEETFYTTREDEFEDEALHENPAYSDYDEDHGDNLGVDIDPQAEAAARKRKANLIFYGGIAAIVVVVGFLAYPQFKRTFVKEQPKQTAMGVPVPMNARESKFSLADPAPQAPAAPVGAVTTPDVAAALPSVPASQSASDASLPAPPSGNAVEVAPPPQIVKPAPSQVDQMQAQITDLASQVTALQTSVVALTADKDATAASLQQLQATLDTLQKQIGVGEAAKAPAPVAEPKVAHPVAAPPHWTLRSATTGMALLGVTGSNQLKTVSVGDNISGLGQIVSISEQNGRWVVKGTSGSVVQ